MMMKKDFAVSLPKKIERTEQILARCTLCERNCKVNRLGGEIGYCGVGARFRIFGAHTHMAEEPELIPSGTLFLAGCTMRCLYCQNAPSSTTPQDGTEWTEERVARWMEEKEKEGCKNINFVGGEPTPYLYNILKALQLTESALPVIWNSNSYYSEETSRLLKGVVNLYLLDFRYFSDKCAVRLSDADNYSRIAKRNILAAAKDSKVIIRVLVMPAHIQCDALPILKWIRENLGPGARVNIMAQYQPAWRARQHHEVHRTLTKEEYSDVLAYAKKIGLTNIVGS